MVCVGCGQPLPPNSGRGRPARYHNATCRQRSRRARLANGHALTLDLLTSLETAARELRRALLTDHDTTDAYARLAQTARDLAGRLDPLHTGPAADAAVTKSVTKPVTQSIIAAASGSGAASPRAADHRVDPATRQPPAPEDPHDTAARPVIIKTVDLTASVGPGWTLVQHADDRIASIWHLHHHGTPAGTVRRGYDLTTNARGWEARTATYDPVRASGKHAASRRGDRLWRTRDTAAAGIAAYLARQRKANAGTANRKRSDPVR